MATLTLADAIVSVAASGSTNVQPAASENWYIMSLNRDNAAVTAAVYDGSTVFDGSMIAWGAYGNKFSINNTYYLRLANSGGSDYNVQYTFAKTDVVSITKGWSVTDGAAVTYQPAADKYYLIKHITKTTSTSVHYYDGSTTYPIVESLAAGTATDVTLLYSNAYYMRFTNSSGGTVLVSVAGSELPTTITAVTATLAISAGGATNLQPAAGVQNALMSGSGENGSSYTWNKYDGTTAVTFSAAGPIRAGVPLSNTNYLRVTSSATKNVVYGYVAGL